MIADPVDRAFAVASTGLCVGDRVPIRAQAFQIGPEGNLPAFARYRGVHNEVLGQPSWDLMVFLGDLIPTTDDLLLYLATTVVETHHMLARDNYYGGTP